MVSELPPGCAPTRLRFLARNRLIAALTRGTVVVEAAVRSGALNTANWAAPAQPAADGGARPGHQRAVRGRAPADPRRAPRPWSPRARRCSSCVGAAGEHLVEAAARAGPRRATGSPPRQQQVLDAVPVARGAPGRLDRPHRRARRWSRSRTALRRLRAAGLVERVADGGWRLAALAHDLSGRRSRAYDSERDASGRRRPRRRSEPARADGRGVLADYERHLVVRARPRRRTPCAPTSATSPACSSTPPASGTTDVADLDLRTLRSWLAKQQTLGRSRTTLARRATAARVFTAWLAAHRPGRRPTPGASLGSPKAHKTLPAGAARRRGRAT